MLRILVVTLTLTALLAFHLVNGTPTAFACSGPGPVEGMLRSPIIIEGRVIAAVPPTSPVAVRPNQAPLVLAFEVDLAHRGASAGSRLDALTYVWSSSFPNPCAALALPEDLVGQYLVIGLDAPESSGGLPLTGVAAFIGEEPAGAEYERGHKVAVMIADSDPTAPIIELGPAAPACGEPFQATGRHFPQGRFVLRGSYDPRVLAVTKVGATGELVMSGIFRPSACAHAQNNGRLTGLWVIAMDDLIPGGGYLGQDALTEVVAMTLTGALDGPDLGFPLQVTPNPA
ncbi:MAG: hypothetical protein IH609_21430, partial [Dehalococcoidia bacterium]|nr:hypothetical protein [Dehalococcoidia bacterium]